MQDQNDRESARLSVAAFEPGSSVVVMSLVSRSDLNGRRGIVQNFVPESGGYVVKFDDEQERILLKPAHMRKDPPTMESFAEFQMFGGCLKEVKELEDNALRTLFAEYAKEAVPAVDASTPDMKSLSLSKKHFADLFKEKYEVTLSEGKLEELISRIDANGDRVIDFNEFRALVRSTSELEMMFKSWPLAQVLAFCFPRGSAAEPLELFFNQHHSEVDAAMRKAGQILTGLTMSMIEQHNDACAAAKKQQAEGCGAKFGAESSRERQWRPFSAVLPPSAANRIQVCVCVCVFVCTNFLV